MEQRQNSLNQMRQSRNKCVLSPAVLFGTLAFILTGSALSAAQTSLDAPCSWPDVSTGSGITNFALPDTNSTYWLMPVDTTLWSGMIIQGQYPQSRFFSFVTYYQVGGAVESIIDADIAPDPGNTNPFMPPGGNRNGQPVNYTIRIDGNTAVSANHIYWGNTQYAFVIYRIYAPDKGLSGMAGVPLPSVTLTDTHGNSHQTQTCSVMNTPGDILLVLTLLNGSSGGGSGSASCQTGNVVTFTPTTSPGLLLPNPATTYGAAVNLCIDPGQNEIIVVRGKAAVFPDTYNGGTIFQPAIPGQIQIRYWSMCNNVEQKPGRVVGCAADYATQLDSQGFYTYVVSYGESASTPTPPAWLPPGTTWLPWGGESAPRVLLFREMLPMPGFSLAGDYLPQGVYCNKETFITQGWQGCFAAAGVPAP
jgi:hypothetical protein